MGHSHGGANDTPARVHARARLLLLLLVVPLLLATVLGLVVLWPADANPPTPDFMGGPAKLADATVVKVDRRACGGTDQAGGAQAGGIDVLLEHDMQRSRAGGRPESQKAARQ